MPIKNYKPEQIVTILRQIEVQMANGKRSGPTTSGVMTLSATEPGRGERYGFCR